MMKVKTENTQKMKKKFYRRTAIFTLLWCATFLNAVEDKLGYESIVRPFKHLGNGGEIHVPRIPHRPFAPHVTVQGESAIQVSWLPVLMSNKQAVRYELFSGDDPEYVGYDLVYVAKRLKAGTEYKFRVRACGHSGCSDFSLTRSCKTPKKGVQERDRSGSKPLFGKRRILLVLLPPLAVGTFLITLVIFVVYFWRFLRYYLWQYSAVSFEPLSQSKYSPGKKLLVEALFADLEMGDQKSDDPKYNKGHEDATYLEFPTEISLDVSKKNQLMNYQNWNPRGDCHVECIAKSPTNKPRSPKRPRSRPGSPKPKRGRASSLEDKDTQRSTDGRIRSVSEGDVLSKRCESDVHREQLPIEPRLKDEALVVIDNSNVFIGAREAACALNPRLRPRHVKVRLQALAQVLEKGRKVTKRFACGSSPPANEHVWDVYRRLGYTIDLEDRRGKDEQRVDEQLHLCIYKAIIEMSPQTLILASGDGNKGKSSGATSFPECVSAAIDHGWNVEVHSWKHSLSAEWLKIAAKHKTNFKIKYLDESINKITYVDIRSKTRDRTDDSHDNRVDDRVRA